MLLSFILYIGLAQKFVGFGPTQSHYYKTESLKQHKCMLLQFQRQEFQNQCHWPKIKSSVRPLFLRGSRRKAVPCHFHLRLAASIPWLLAAPPSPCLHGHIASISSVYQISPCLLECHLSLYLGPTQIIQDNPPVLRSLT